MMIKTPKMTETAMIILLSRRDSLVLDARGERRGLCRISLVLS